MNLDLQDLAEAKQSFAQRLRAAREAKSRPDGKRMSQQNLAEAIGVTTRAVQTWEDPHDASLPDGKNLFRIERLLGVTLTGRYLKSLLESVAS